MVLLLVLRWVHFLGGVAWIGTIFYLGSVQLPAMRRGKLGAMSPEYVTWLNNLMVATSMSSVIAGVSMALILSGLNTEVFVSTIRGFWGIAILLGGMFALASLVLTFAGVIPALQRLSSPLLTDSEKIPLLEKAQTWLKVTMLTGATVLLLMASAVTL